MCASSGGGGGSGEFRGLPSLVPSEKGGLPHLTYDKRGQRGPSSSLGPANDAEVATRAAALGSSDVVPRRKPAFAGGAMLGGV